MIPVVIAIAASIAIAGSQEIRTGGAARTGVADIVARLRERHDSIHGISCVYRWKMTPTAYFVKRAAQEMELPAQRLIDNYSVLHTRELLESADGRYLLKMTQFDAAGKPIRRDVFGFDGKTHWKQVKVPLDGDKTGEQFRDSQTHLGGKDGESAVDAASPPLRYLGDSVLTSTKPLFSLIQEGRDPEFVGRGRIDGAPCVAVRWSSMINGAEVRVTVWLDESKNLVLRRSLDEYRPPHEEWIKATTCEVSETGRTRVKTKTGVMVDYYYPKVILSEMFNSDEKQKTFDERCDVEEVRLNPPITSDLFSLTVDEGTGVLSLDTGKYSVHGGGPGPKLKKLIDRRISEARKQSRDSETQLPPGQMTPPAPLATYGMWTALALGVAGLASALTLWVRRFRDV